MEQYTITPAGKAALEALSAVPFLVVAMAAALLFALTVLMPYYIWRTASDMRKLRLMAEHWLRKPR